MSDINISLDEANAWINKVEKEMEEAERLLQQVTECVKDYTDTDDSIYKELHEAADNFSNAWKQLGNGYKSVFEGLRNVFALQIKAVQDAIEAVKREKQKSKS